MKRILSWVLSGVLLLSALMMQVPQVHAAEAYTLNYVEYYPDRTETSPFFSVLDNTALRVL